MIMSSGTITVDLLQASPENRVIEVNGRQVPIADYVLVTVASFGSDAYRPVYINSKKDRLKRFKTIEAAAEFAGRAFASAEDYRLRAVIDPPRRRLFKCLPLALPKLYKVDDAQQEAFALQVSLIAGARISRLSTSRPLTGRRGPEPS